MFKTSGILIAVFSILTITSCTCSYCGKLDYVNTQTTIEVQVQNEARELSKITDMQEEDIIKSLASLISGNLRIFGAAYATAPYNDPKQLIELYYEHHEGTDVKTLYYNAFDFVNSEIKIWYLRPYLTKKAMWSIPYYIITDSGKEFYITTYSYPVLC